MKKIKLFQIGIFFLILQSCAQSSKQSDNASALKSKEFEDLVKVEKVEIISKESENIKTKKMKTEKNDLKKQILTKVKNTKNSKTVSKKNKAKQMSKASVNKVMLTDNSINAVTSNKALSKSSSANKNTINEERIAKSPFRIGEKTVIEVSYLNMIAGHLILETKGVVKVNGKYSYHFRGSIKSRKLFSFVYSVDDVADTYVDIESLRPYSLNFKVVETKKTKDSKTFFNWKTKKATYWSRKVRKGRKVKEVKKTWKLVPGAQNFVSSLFYLRTIDFSKVKTFTFPMADEGKNVTLNGKVIRKERISTEAGSFDAWLVEPKFTIDGSLTPVGELKMWFRADKNQNLVKVQTKLKFGSILGEATKIVKGTSKGLRSIEN